MYLTVGWFLVTATGECISLLVGCLSRQQANVSHCWLVACHGNRRMYLIVGWLLNVTATGECISLLVSCLMSRQQANVSHCWLVACHGNRQMYPRVGWLLKVTATGERISLLVGCLKSQQQASVSQVRACSDSCTCSHTETEVAGQTLYLAQSQYTDTEQASPSTEPKTPGAWQGSHRTTNFEVTDMT